MTAEELNKALAAFLIAFGATLPAELAQRIRQRTEDLADDIERGGEPNVARLARGLADALAGVHSQPPR